MPGAWESLQPSDEIVFVFPSHLPQPQFEENFPKKQENRCRAETKKLGLILSGEDSIMSLHTEEEWGEKADAPQRRAGYIIAALENPNVKAIFARGGHGGNEVIFELEKYFNENDLPARSDAPPLLGYSDATQLLLYLGEKGWFPQCNYLVLKALRP